MKAVVILLIIAVFGACLFVGIQAGNASLPVFDAPSLTSTNPKPLAAANPQQRTLLLLGVDDLQAETPRLTSLWLALYRPDLPRVTALPLFPTGDPSLADAFSLNPDRSVHTTFWDRLRGLQINWTGYILIDQAGLAALVDTLGGVEMAGQWLDGASTAASLPMAWDDPRAAGAAQSQLAEALCRLLAETPAETDWAPFLANSLDSHLYTNVDLDGLVNDWKGLITPPNQFACEFPIP